MPGIGRYYHAKLARLGIETVGDLVNHFPHRYLDYGHPSLISDLVLNSDSCLRVKLYSKAVNRTRRGQLMVIGQFTDSSGKITAIWFNQEYRLNQLTVGQQYFLAGRPGLNKLNQVCLVSPSLELVERGGKFTTGLVPIYPLTEGLSSRFLQQKIDIILPQLEFKDFLPSTVLDQAGLLGLNQAYRQVHQPKHNLEIEPARKRLAFNDLLAVQLKSQLTKQNWQRKSSPQISIDAKFLNRFYQALPFTPTADQLAAIKEINADLAMSVPMNRLLQGDVGAGKTLVAAAAVLSTLNSGYQAIILAPTQVLANQHHQTLSDWLKPYGYEPVLVTGGTKANQTAALLVGTQALLHRKKLLNLHRLGLVVIDEQHRFGVLQRSEFFHLRHVPHLLTMTATPIPRTIALAMYGHLELSFLRHKPTGRLPTKTWLVPELKRVLAYQWVKRELEQHHQAFVVCPLVEQSSSDSLKDVKAATIWYQKIKQDFSGFKVGLLHGRLKAEDKTKVLGRFASGKLSLLVTTPVVEVGVDIPQATVMIIEDAWKFGLAQLHQLRGRVGRDRAQSYCLLFSGSNEAAINQRLHLVEQTNDGLALAEADLRLRGPGEIFGISQSGHLDTNFEYFWDESLTELAKTTAVEISHRPGQARRILSLLDSSLAKSVASN